VGLPTVDETWDCSQVHIAKDQRYLCPGYCMASTSFADGCMKGPWEREGKGDGDKSDP